jgi:hypothetical protein
MNKNICPFCNKSTTFDYLYTTKDGDWFMCAVCKEDFIL